MTNTISIVRSLIIYGLSLPLAIFLGYTLAMPMDRTGLAFIVVALFLPMIPILLRWHHFLLVLSWNMIVVLFFIPGSPYLWMVMTAISLALTALQQILKRNVSFASVPSVTLPLLFLAGVVLITAKLTGGIGLRSFGAEAMGGKRYIMVLGAIAGYFALTSHRVPRKWGVLYVAVFWLGSLTSLMGSVAPWVPSSLRVIYALFPVENIEAFTGGTVLSDKMVRLGGMSVASASIYYYILARHGFRGLFPELGERWRFLPFGFSGGLSINQPWRILFFIGSVGLSLMGGFRGTPILLLLTLVLLFYLEGLYRTQVLPILVLLGVLTLAVGLPFVDRLPLTVQRSLSFLPLNIDPVARLDAEDSSEWRKKMWREVIPLIPQYLLVGKGYAIDAKESDAETTFSQFNTTDTSGWILASDFHNGPLTILIPLGLFGLLGFVWFLVAGYRVLLSNYRYCDPELKVINSFMLTYFITKVIFYFLVFGSFYGEFMLFTGVVGLSVCINGGVRAPAKPAPAPNPAYMPFRLPKGIRA